MAKTIEQHIADNTWGETPWENLQILGGVLRELFTGGIAGAVAGDKVGMPIEGALIGVGTKYAGAAMARGRSGYPLKKRRRK